MELIRYAQNAGVGTLTLNSPDNLNAMTPAMGDAIRAAVQDLNQKQDLRVVILKGAGRAFSAGGDLQFILDHTTPSPEDNAKEMFDFYGKFLALRDIEVPTIAQIQGPAIGAGMLIALACDLRYASEKAKLGVNFAKLGLSSGMGGLYSLQRIVGPAVAADLLFTGRICTAEEARELQLVNAIFPEEELESRVLDLASNIAQNAPVALKIMKQGLQKTAYQNLEDALRYEAWGQGQCFETQDLREGIAAIREKRVANFSGK